MDGDPNGTQETPQGAESNQASQVPEVSGADGAMIWMFLQAEVSALMPSTARSFCCWASRGL